MLSLVKFEVFLVSQKGKEHLKHYKKKEICRLALSLHVHADSTSSFQFTYNQSFKGRTRLKEVCLSFCTANCFNGLGLNLSRQMACRVTDTLLAFYLCTRKRSPKRLLCGGCGISYLLYRRKFSSAKNVVKSDRQAVRQEFIFVKSRSSLVCSLLVKNISQEFNLVKKLL